MDDVLSRLMRATESFARSEERGEQRYPDRDGTVLTTEEWAALVDTLEAGFRARLASASGLAAGEGEALEKRVQAWGANLCEALGRRYPTMEEVVGASIAAIHESRRASETPDEEKLPHRPPQTEDGA